MASDTTPSAALPRDLKARIASSYDAIAPAYNTWTEAHSPLRLEYLSRALAYLPTTPAPVRVLELGAGCGVPVSQTLLARENYSVVANDISSTQLEIARSTLVPALKGSSRLELVGGDMLALEFAGESFDAVVGMYSIIHLPCDEQVAMLAKIAAWLKPGGVLLANFGRRESEVIEAQNWLQEEKGWMFWSGWGAEGTVQKVEEAGLQVLVKDVLEDNVDGVDFLWLIAKKG